MKQNITIEVPEGKVAKFNPETNTIEFLDKEPIRSKSWEEFCKNHPIIKNEWYFDNRKTWAILGLHEEERTNKKSLLETKEDAEGILALIQLTRLHDEWVGDWALSLGGKSFTYVHTYDGKIRVSCANDQWSKLLIFPTQEMAEEFLRCFKDLIETAKKFI